jgi:hypothetical protein
LAATGPKPFLELEQYLPRLQGDNGMRQVAAGIWMPNRCPPAVGDVAVLADGAGAV